MPTIYYNDANFRALFPAYASPTLYMTSAIQLWWNSSTAYLSDKYCGPRWGALTLAQQTLALNYMTAHLLYINSQAGMNQDTGLITAASIDKISVSIQPPPELNQWQWWLNQSPYGKQLLALLQIATVGGRFFNPVPTFTAFRR